MKKRAQGMNPEFVVDWFVFVRTAILVVTPL